MHYLYRVFENIRIQLGKTSGGIAHVGQDNDNLPNYLDWFEIGGEIYGGKWNEGMHVYSVYYVMKTWSGSPLDEKLVLTWTRDEYDRFCLGLFPEFRPGNIPWKMVHEGYYSYHVQDDSGHLVVAGILEDEARIIVESVNERVLKLLPEFLKKKREREAKKN